MTSYSFYSNNEFELKEMSTFLFNHLLNPNWNEINFEKENFLKFIKMKENLIDCIFKKEILKNLNLNFENEINIKNNLNLFEDIKKYHSKYYSISNCLFISTGGNYLNVDMDMDSINNDTDMNMINSNSINSSNSNSNSIEIKRNKKEFNFIKNEIKIETNGIKDNSLIGLSYKMKNVKEMNENEFYFYKIFFEFLISPNNGILSKFKYYLLPESEYDLTFEQSFLNLYFDLPIGSGGDGDNEKEINLFNFEFNSFINDISNYNLMNNQSIIDFIENLISNLEINLKLILENGDIFNFISSFHKLDIDFLSYLNINLILKYLKQSFLNSENINLFKIEFKNLILNNNQKFRIILLPSSTNSSVTPLNTLSSSSSKENENENENDLFNNFNFENLIHKNYYKQEEEEEGKGIEKINENIYFNKIETNGITKVSIFSKFNESLNNQSSESLLLIPLTIKVRIKFFYF